MSDDQTTVSPVIAGGRVVGTWRTTGDRLEVELFAEARDHHPGSSSSPGRAVPREALEAEAARIGQHLGTALTLAVS